MIFRLILLAVGLGASYIGSLCFQNGTGSDMAVGAGAIFIGILSFFFLAKGLWRLLGCLSTFLLVTIVVGVLFFLISGSDIVKNITASILHKTEQISTPSQPAHPPQLPALPQAAGAAPQAGSAPQPQQAVQPAPQPQPQQPPTIKGRIETIVSGDVFRMGQYTIRLFGIASPLVGQNCTDQNGHSYECGYVAARMLKNFVSGDEISCRIMNVNAQNELMAACSVGTFDIGAAMVEEGWAIALPTITPIYVPYQTKAQQAKKGLWAGRFQMPWEWEAQQKQIQEQKAKIKVPNLPSPQTKKKKSIFDVF